MKSRRVRRRAGLGACTLVLLLAAGCEPYAEKAARAEAEAAAREAAAPPPAPEPVQTTSGAAPNDRPAGSALGGAIQNAQNLVEQHNQRQEDLEDLMEQ